jgi:hypothetical protein
MRRLLFLFTPLWLAGCASAPAPTAPVATSAGPAPGHWQLVLEVSDLPGALKAPPPQTMTLCSTPEDKRQWMDMIGGKSAAGCSIRNYEAGGPTIRYVMQCSGGIEGSTLITVIDDDHYRGESTLTMNAGDKPMTLHSKVTATRLAPVCKK